MRRSAFLSATQASYTGKKAAVAGGPDRVNRWPLHWTWLWQSQPLTSNAQNFLIKGDAIVTGYGFTAEPRYIYIVNKGDGRIANRLQIHNYPDYFVEEDGKLYVRAYDTDYVFDYAN